MIFLIFHDFPSFWVKNLVDKNFSQQKFLVGTNFGHLAKISSLYYADEIFLPSLFVKNGHTFPDFQEKMVMIFLIFPRKRS